MTTQEYAYHQWMEQQKRNSILRKLFDSTHNPIYRNHTLQHSTLVSVEDIYSALVNESGDGVIRLEQSENAVGREGNGEIWLR